MFVSSGTNTRLYCPIWPNIWLHPHEFASPVPWKSEKHWKVEIKIVGPVKFVARSDCRYKSLE
jgi:hypothetical protein